MSVWLGFLCILAFGGELEIRDQHIDARSCKVQNDNLIVFPALANEIVHGIENYTISFTDIYSGGCLSDSSTGLRIVLYDAHTTPPPISQICSSKSSNVVDLPCNKEKKLTMQIKLPLNSGIRHALSICNCDLLKRIEFKPDGGKIEVRGSWGNLSFHLYPLVVATELFSYVMFTILILFVILCIKRRHRVEEPQKCVIAFYFISFIYALVIHHCYYELNLSNQYFLILAIFRDIIGAFYRLSIVVLQIVLSVGWGLLYVSLIKKWVMVGVICIGYVILTVARDAVEYFVGHTYNVLMPLMQLPMIIFTLFSYYISNKCVRNMIHQLEFHNDYNGSILYRRQYLLNGISTFLLISESAIRIAHFFLPIYQRLSYSWIASAAFLIIGVIIYSIWLSVLWRPRDIDSFSKITQIVEDARLSLFGDGEDSASPITSDKIIGASVAMVVDSNELEQGVPVTIQMPPLNV